MKGKPPTRRALPRHCSALVALGVGWVHATAHATPTAKPARSPHTVLVLGDSVSAEYGLQRGQGWVALLTQRLASEKIAASVVNASISGDTTASGRSRLPALLKQHRPSIVIVELGGNDALRGLPLAAARENLIQMVRSAKQAGAAVLVAGIQVPPNYGRQYSAQFAALFADVARAENTALVPLLLKGVDDGPNPTALFQADRIHPTAQAQAQLLANVWPVLRPLLR